ncbi:MAG TPA: PilZ domain-containing protein [Blastocatellia bacterium]|nr:PilZ domain-containing protein [Blastocatellia bacterium]
MGRHSGPLGTRRGNSGKLNNSGPLGQSRRGNTGRLVSAYYLEVEHLLERLERTPTHYQILGIERSASHEQILSAYHQTVKLLYPSYKIGTKLPPETLARIDRAFEKVSHAFFTLASSARRQEYDRSLSLKASGASRPNNVIPMPGATSESKAARPASEPDAVKIRQASTPSPVSTKAASESGKDNRRRFERFKLAIPTRVTGHDVKDGKWQEVSHTLNVSRIGVALRLRQRVRPGMVLHLALPLPAKLRSHGFCDPGYNAYAIVRRVEPVKDGLREVGLEFIGERPPTGYLEKPWAIFRTQKWTGADRRREPRHARNEPVGIEFLDQAGKTIALHAGVTENISRSGARVCLKAAPPDFEMVRIIGRRNGFDSLAIVRSLYRGGDGCARLCLQFMDKKWPI